MRSNQNKFIFVLSTQSKLVNETRSKTLNNSLIPVVANDGESSNSSNTVNTRRCFNVYKTSIRRRRSRIDVLQTLKRRRVSTGNAQISANDTDIFSSQDEELLSILQEFTFLQNSSFETNSSSVRTSGYFCLYIQVRRF